MQYYGTLGPACQKEEILLAMFRAGITGMRLNLSHGGLDENGYLREAFQNAAKTMGIAPELLLDLQGPELRVGNMSNSLCLKRGEKVSLVSAEDPVGDGEIPLPSPLFRELREGDALLLDDGRILLKASREGTGWKGTILRGGTLLLHKSVALEGREIPSPALTEQDRANLSLASRWGVTGVMQPFVRKPEDLLELRRALQEAGAGQVRIFAKIESWSGMDRLKELLPFADEIVIARGDLGNSIPLWELPAAQKEIAGICRKAGKPFMVVTQLLASMEQNAVPTRAEVSDIFNAVLDGASSLMVTGETAVGKYPELVSRYLVKTGEEARRFVAEKQGGKW